MSGRKPLAAPQSIAYQYDGGLKGFYCCVYESVYTHCLPMAIWPDTQAQLTMLPAQWIHTDDERAQRVREGIRKNISPRAVELVETVFLSCMPEKEMPLLRFLLLAFQNGSATINRHDHPDVSALLKAERHLGGEAHLLKGFIRFSDHDGALLAAIKPKNFVLPFLADHFMQRLSQENFMIYDKTNRAALLYENHVGQIFPMESFPELEPSEDELFYQALWKRFYHTIAIPARENPRCRMSHMPKRYWSEMTEMRELL